MSSPDPGFWQQAANYLWGVLLIPVGMLWKKADGAIQRDEFKEYAKEAREAHAELRESLRDLYRNAEADRKLVRDGFDQVNKSITDARFDLLEKINER